MSIDGISGISSISNQSINRIDNAIDNLGYAPKNDTFYNLLISQDRDGTVFHELCLTTGNIDTCKISNPKEAENVMKSGETFRIAQADPNQPSHLTRGISYLV